MSVSSTTREQVMSLLADQERLQRVTMDKLKAADREVTELYAENTRLKAENEELLRLLQQERREGVQEVEAKVLRALRVALQRGGELPKRKHAAKAPKARPVPRVRGEARICAVAWCEQRANSAAGYCSTHEVRRKQKGDPLLVNRRAPGGGFAPARETGPCQYEFITATEDQHDE